MSTTTTDVTFTNVTDASNFATDLITLGVAHLRKGRTVEVAKPDDVLTTEHAAAVESLALVTTDRFTITTD